MDYFLKWNSTWKPPMSNQEPWCSLEHREDSAPGLPERGYTGLGSFALIPIHRLLDDPFSTSLQLVSPISSWSLCEYIDCAGIYAENSWLFCPFWSKMLRSFPFQPSRVERPGLFLLGAWNPFPPWKMWVYDAHLCCLRLPLQNIL